MEEFEDASDHVTRVIILKRKEMRVDDESEEEGRRKKAGRIKRSRRRRNERLDAEVLCQEATAQVDEQ